HSGRSYSGRPARLAEAGRCHGRDAGDTRWRYRHGVSPASRPSRCPGAGRGPRCPEVRLALAVRGRPGRSVRCRPGPALPDGRPHRGHRSTFRTMPRGRRRPSRGRAGSAPVTDPDAAVDGRREAGRAAVSAASLAATLRGAMHLAFVVLLSVGTVRAHDVDGAPLPLTLLAAAAIAVIYGLGSRFALRRAGSGEAEWTDLLLPSRGWVLLLTLAWMAGTIVSTAFVWIAFPLFFLVLFSLGRVAGPLALAGVALWAVLAPLIAREQWTLEIG